MGKRYRLPGGGELVLNYKEFNALRRSPEVQKDLGERARRIAHAAGAGFVDSVRDGRHTARASVATETPQAMRKQAEEGNTLQRALGAGR